MAIIKNYPQVLSAAPQQYPGTSQAGGGQKGCSGGCGKGNARHPTIDVSRVARRLPVVAGRAPSAPSSQVANAFPRVDVSRLSPRVSAVPSLPRPSLPRPQPPRGPLVPILGGRRPWVPPPGPSPFPPKKPWWLTEDHSPDKDSIGCPCGMRVVNVSIDNGDLGCIENARLTTNANYNSRPEHRFVHPLRSGTIIGQSHLDAFERWGEGWREFATAVAISGFTNEWGRVTHQGCAFLAGLPTSEQRRIVNMVWPLTAEELDVDLDDGMGNTSPIVLAGWGRVPLLPNNAIPFDVPAYACNPCDRDRLPPRPLLPDL